MRRTVMPLLLMATATICAALPSAALAAAAPDTVQILTIRGPAYWRANPSAREVKLDPKHALRRKLHVDEAVKCGPGGSLDLEQYGKRVHLTAADGWYPILRPAPPAPPPGVDKAARRISAQAQIVIAGKIEEIRPPAFLRRTASSPPTALDPNADRNDLLMPGAALRCDPGGELRFLLYGKEVRLTGPSAWFPIPAPPPPPGHAVK